MLRQIANAGSRHPAANIGAEMKNTEIAQQIAREAGISEAAAADQLDEVVTSILKRVNKGGSANLPGIGNFRRDFKGVLKLSQIHPRGSHGPK